MSASDKSTAIYMSDTAKEIKKKTNGSFSGGQETKELHRELGGNPDVDVAFQYLGIYGGDKRVMAGVEADYREGTLLTGDLKKMCIVKLQEYVAGLQERRGAITKEVLEDFMRIRPLKF